MIAEELRPNRLLPQTEASYRLSVMPVLEEEGAHVIMPAGATDDDPGVRPIVHIHTASKAPWLEITDALPQFAKFPPEESWAQLESKSIEDAP